MARFAEREPELSGARQRARRFENKTTILYKVSPSLMPTPASRGAHSIHKRESKDRAMAK
jgi:hypothetical protein